MPSQLWCSARFSSWSHPVHPLHYSTQFTHQSILSSPSLIRRRHPIIHLLLSKQFFRIHRSFSTCSQAHFLLDDLQSPLVEPLKTEYILISLPEQLKKIPDRLFPSTLTLH